MRMRDLALSVVGMIALVATGLEPSALLAPNTQPALARVAVAAVWPPAQVAHRVAPSVVGVTNLRRGPSGTTVPAGSGSGVVFSSDGAIVTNYHVVAGADALQVTLSDGRTLVARVVGVDPPTDLAVIRVGARLTPARWADSSRVDVGAMAIAIGNPMGPGFARTVTVGVVSGLRRSLGAGYAQRAFDLIQTDAAINPGNSGGPLLNADGEVIGINSVKIAAPGVEGMGFAIPSNSVQSVAHAILTHGRVIRPWLGLALLPRETALRLGLPVPERGLRVERVYPGSPADRSGLRTDDALVAIGREPVHSLGDVFRILSHHRVGDPLALTIVRRGATQTVTVELSALPAGAAVTGSAAAPGA